MLLYDSFLSLHAPVLSISFQGCVMKRADLELAMKKAVSCYRCLVDPAKIAAYQHFLAQCKHSLSHLEEIPLLEVMINHLAADELSLNDQDSCEKLTQLFSLGFQDQHDALGILSLGRVFIDRPKAFAAFLRCMLQREVTFEQILAAQLLQDFFRYDLSSLHQKNNSIEQLYGLLDAFSDTAQLSARAKTICCEEGGLSSYALDGTQHKAGSLITIPCIHTPLCFTAVDTNLKALHDIFGVSFLMGGLDQWSFQKNNATWINTVTQLFNHSYTVDAELPQVVNRLHEHPAIQSALALILSDETLDRLVKNHVVGIFNLIPFCPGLADKIHIKDLPMYLQTLRVRSASGLALISSLFALFNGIKSSHVDAATLVFDTLLDAILADPYVLDDTLMIGKLRKFSYGNGCILRKVRALEAALDAIIQQQTQADIVAMDYIVVEDAWRDTFANIQGLQEVLSFKTTCPLDKYKLYTRLASSFFAHGNVVFDLDAFTLALGVQLLFHEENITFYERFIIELLTTIDDERLRTECITILDTHVKHRWRTCSYAGLGLFVRATLVGNLGFLRWMNNEKMKSDLSYDCLAIAAAQENQWAIVAYFHTSAPLKQNTIDQLLHLAVLQDALHAMPTLWDNKQVMPTLKAIERAFKLAVKKNDTKSLLCLTGFPKQPCDAVVASGFKLAINFKFFDLAKIIAEHFGGGLLRAAIDQAMKDAARFNQCDVLTLLGGFNTNVPTQHVIESALMGAIRANHLTTVQWLVGFAGNPPSSHAIQKARQEAHKQHLTTIEAFLATLCPQTNKRTVLCFQQKRARWDQDDELIPLRPHSEPTQLHPHVLKRAVSCSSSAPNLLLQRHGLFKSTNQVKGETIRLCRSLP